MRQIDGFDTTAYQRRLRLLREIISGENQQDFAARLGIPFKRWSNYERGYPVPRETAFLLMAKFPGISVEWVWFGLTGNLSQHYADKIKAAEAHERELLRAVRKAAEAEEKLREVKQKRKKVIHASGSRR